MCMPGPGHLLRCVSPMCMSSTLCRSLQKAASGKAATKLKGMLNNASRASARITDKAAIHAKSVADKATMQAKSATRRMSFLRGGQPRQESSEDGGSSRKLPEPIAEGLSPRCVCHAVLILHAWWHCLSL